MSTEHKFRVGQKVRCIDDSSWVGESGVIKAGDVVVVRGFLDGDLLLEGISDTNSLHPKRFIPFDPLVEALIEAQGK